MGEPARGACAAPRRRRTRVVHLRPQDANPAATGLASEAARWHRPAAVRWRVPEHDAEHDAERHGASASKTMRTGAGNVTSHSPWPARARTPNTRPAPASLSSTRRCPLTSARALLESLDREHGNEEARKLVQRLAIVEIMLQREPARAAGGGTRWRTFDARRKGEPDARRAVAGTHRARRARVTHR